MIATSTADITVDLPGCSVALAPDLLFGRMAATGQGWRIRNEHDDFRPALSSLDLAILETIRRPRSGVPVSRSVCRGW